MKNVLYTVAVLASLCDDNANSPNVVASVIDILHGIDQRMLDLVRTDAQMLNDQEALLQKSFFDMADAQIEKLSEIGLNAELYYNDELPFGVRSRFRIVIPNSAWDYDAPLYLS
jgi:hypothetical protein